MLQLLYCIFLLFPLIGLAIGGFYISTTVGIIGAVLSAALAIPPVLGLLAHLDLLKMKSLYNLSDVEMKSFVRLVPRLVSQESLSGVPPKKAKNRAKARAVQIIRHRSTAVND